MKLDRRGIGYQVLIPVFLLVLLVALALLGIMHVISTHVQDDYLRFSVMSAASGPNMVLELAASELIAAKLTGNPVVIEAKKRSVLETIRRSWAQSGQHGVVSATGEAVLFSTLPPEDTAAIVANRAEGYHVVDAKDGHYHCWSSEFPLWGWTVTTAIPHAAFSLPRKEVLLLVPVMAGGSLLIFGGLYLILRRNLQRPVEAMVAAVRAGGGVPSTGVAEFDHVGSAVNSALAEVRDRSAQLAAELEERRRVEISVREKERRIRLLLDSTAEGIYGVDTDGSCTFCNPAGLRLLGYGDEQELLGKNIHVLTHYRRSDGSPYPEEACRVHQAYRMRSGVHVDDEVFLRKDGMEVPVEYWSYPIVSGDETTGAVVTFIDITERKRTEAALREEKNKFEAIIAALGEGLSIQDRDLRVVYQNEVQKSIVGPHIGELCHQAYQSKENPCEGCPVILAYKDGQVHIVERTRETPDGTRYYEVAASPLRNGSGEIVAGIELVRDVTERKRTELQLQQAQKMEAVGQLAGGIAHDFNNILTAITGYASFLVRRSDEGSQQRHFGEQILAATERATALTRQILAFSRKQVIMPREVRVNDLVRGMEKMLFRLLGEDIEVRIALTDEDTTVLADPVQIEQVLLNLATNARDAMPGGGGLHISTEIAELDAPTARSKGLKRGGRFVLLLISDTGEGMSDAVRQRIFEPFFTTKELGRGTGLGLSIVYGIVAQHEGQISVSSETGEGTSFRIYLPLVTPAAEAQARPRVSEPPRGTETVLLAEDDEHVRDIARLTLAEAGYRVIVATDGEDAVAKFREHRDEVQLCLFDLMMPKKNGIAAIEDIRAIRPGIRALFMSGYAADLIRSKMPEGAGAEVLDKPLVPEALLVRVRKVLDA